MWKKGWKRKNEEEAGGGGAAPSRKFAKKDLDDDGGDDGIVVCQISKNRRVSVRLWQGKVVVDIREFYVKDGKELPGKKGHFLFSLSLSFGLLQVIFLCCVPFDEGKRCLCCIESYRFGACFCAICVPFS
ncbi:hypothetical protein GW17_00037799 [Ensete ventricosum]|nr:hypothetical protein GW17_00037799 [Ensete ventricosum]